MSFAQRIAVVFFVFEGLISPIALARAEEKADANTPASNQTAQSPRGATTSPAPAASPGATTAVPQSPAAPSGIQITNTQTVNPPVGLPPMQPGAVAPPMPAAPAAPSTPAVREVEKAPGASPRSTADPRTQRGLPFRYERHIRPGLTAAGVTLWVTSYALTILSAAIVGTNCDPGNAELGCTSARWPLFIPVAGPFVQMGYLEGTNSGTARALLAVDGVLQAGGAAMALIGLLAQKKVLVPVFTAGRFRLTPYSPASGIGMAAATRF